MVSPGTELRATGPLGRVDCTPSRSLSVGLEPSLVLGIRPRVDWGGRLEVRARTRNAERDYVVKPAQSIAGSMNFEVSTRVNIFEDGPRFNASAVVSRTRKLDVFENLTASLIATNLRIIRKSRSLGSIA
jgi:hypothetical protein